LTFCLAAVSTSNHVIAIRFFVGLLESIFYPAAHMILGSWYKPSELAKRACIFHATSAAASMFSGYLQAGVYKGMNGLHGLPGWKWLFIMDGVISLPIACAGFFLIPDLPENSRAFYLRKDQIELAVKRMDDVGRAPRSKLGWSAWKRIFGRWHVYLLTILYIIFINAVSCCTYPKPCPQNPVTPTHMTMSQQPSGSVQPFTLWLKATGKYSIELINVIPTSQAAVQLVLTVLFAVFSDHWRNRPALMSVSTFWGFFTAVVLAVWTVPDGLKWFAFEMFRAYVPYGPISMAWAKYVLLIPPPPSSMESCFADTLPRSEICSADAEERAIVLGIMNAFGYAVNAWLPYLVFPAVDAPQFHKGFIFSSVMFVAQAGITWLVWFMHRREVRKKAEPIA
jgi:ACS family pantothenate transporter-like MFS transporter